MLFYFFLNFFFCFQAIAGTPQDSAPFTSQAYEFLDPFDAIVLRYGENAPTIIYLHGFMMSGLEVYRILQPEIASTPFLQQFNWIFPNALRGGWFQIEIEDPTLWNSQLVQTRKKFTRMLSKAKIDPHQVIWAGFSQGATTAMDYVLHSLTRPLGLLMNSGFYFNSTEWKRNNQVLEKLPFVMTHDPTDQIALFSQARKFSRLLRENGLKGKLEKNHLGHEIPRGTLQQSIEKIYRPSPLKNCQIPLKKIRHR